MQPTHLPKITIGVLSWNRLYYLRATLESAKVCIQYPNLEWIISDNFSVEQGLRKYIEGLDWVDHKIFRQQTHAEAMNQIVTMADGELILLWPDDIQFVVAGDWMVDIVELLLANEWIGSVGLNCLRRVTCNQLFHPQIWSDVQALFHEFRENSMHFRVPRTLHSDGGYSLRTYGWTYAGIIPSGIPSLTRKEIWQQIGSWRATRALGESIKDSSLGAEDDMRYRYLMSDLVLQRAIPIVPVAADIVTDPTGCKAKVRANKRYGVYSPPPEGTFYYHVYQQQELAAENNSPMPLAFEDYIRPLGFELPLDGNGGLLKSSINLEVVSDILPTAIPSG